MHSRIIKGQAFARQQRYNQYGGSEVRVLSASHHSLSVTCLMNNGLLSIQRIGP